MQNSRLELLLKKAKELEKKYEWLQAAEFYKKASDSALKEKDSLKLGEIGEKIGFCYFKAAFQANTNNEFNKRMKQTIETYERIAILFQNNESENSVTRFYNSKVSLRVELKQ